MQTNPYSYQGLAEIEAEIKHGKIQKRISNYDGHKVKIVVLPKED